MKEEKIVSELENKATNFYFIYLICAVLLRDFSGSISDIGKKDHQEELSYNEMAFLIGLWIKKCSLDELQPISYERDLNWLDAKMKELHWSLYEDDDSIRKMIESKKANFTSNSMHFKEAFFYSSTGAYDFQYIKIAKQKYEKDKVWLKRNFQISPDNFESFFLTLKSKINKRLNNRKTTNGGIQSDSLIGIFCFTKNDFKEADRPILKHFTSQLFKNENKSLLKIGDPNTYKFKPIIQLDDHNYFVPFPFFVAESFYETPFYWMLQDKNYKSKSLENRGSQAEDITYQMLSNVFLKDNLYRGIKIIKNRSTTISDIDILCIHDNVGLIFQIKSKKLTLLSKQGDINQIKLDFNSAIKDAFEQGVICEECIYKHLDYQFQNSIGDSLNVKIAQITKTYIICIVLDTYPALTHSTNIFLLDDTERSTIAFPVFDLAVIASYLNRPESFIDYISKRIDNCRYYRAENELCFLGYYLENDLQILDEFTHKLVDSSFAARIDREYYTHISGFNPTKMNNKMGRNELCYCGSQVKFKYCHGRKNQL